MVQKCCLVFFFREKCWKPWGARPDISDIVRFDARSAEKPCNQSAVSEGEFGLWAATQRSCLYLSFATGLNLNDWQTKHGAFFRRYFSLKPVGVSIWLTGWSSSDWPVHLCGWLKIGCIDRGQKSTWLLLQPRPFIQIWLLLASITPASFSQTNRGHRRGLPHCPT